MIKVKLTSLLLCIVCLSMLATGCSTGNAKRELNSLAIVLGIAIDFPEGEDESHYENFGKDGEKLLLTSQVVRNIAISQNSSASESAGSGAEGDLSKPYWNVQCVGSNLLETLRSAIHVSNRKLYIAQNQVIILNKEVAEKGVLKYIDYFFRDHESRYDVSLVVSEGKASEILNVVSHLEGLPAADLEKLILRQNQASESPECTLYDFVLDMKTPHKATAVPMVRIVTPKDEESSPFLYVAGCAIFKDGKLVETLEEKDTRGLLWLLDEVHLGVLAVQDGDTKISVELLDGTGKFEVDFVDGKIKVKSVVKATGTLGELQGALQVNPEYMDKIRALCVEEVEHEVKAAFEKIQAAGADAIGVGEYLYRFHNSVWKDITENFDEFYKDAEFDLEVDIDLIRTGSLLEATDEEGGELYD